MKKFISKLRMSISILLLVGFWGISVSGVNYSLSDSQETRKHLSESDETPKEHLQPYPNRMDSKKVFDASIRIGWSQKKFLTPLSESDESQKGR